MGESVEKRASGWRLGAGLGMAGLSLAVCAPLAGARPAAHLGEKPRLEKAAAPVSAATYRPFPDRLADDCYRSPVHDTADLCAQWRAAVAAERSATEAADANHWAQWAVGIGAATLLATQGGLFWSLGQTGRALAAARQANEIARSAHERELRAYVSFGAMSIFDVAPGAMPYVQFEVRHSGTSPAYGILSCLQIELALPGETNPRILFQRPVGQVRSRVTMHPGDPEKIGRTTLARPLSADECEAIRSGAQRLVCAGMLSYRDAFGRRHRTTIKCVSGRQTDATTFDTWPCERGNNAN